MKCSHNIHQILYMYIHVFNRSLVCIECTNSCINMYFHRNTRYTTTAHTHTYGIEQINEKFDVCHVFCKILPYVICGRCMFQADACPCNLLFLIFCPYPFFTLVNVVFPSFSCVVFIIMSLFDILADAMLMHRYFKLLCFVILSISIGIGLIVDRHSDTTTKIGNDITTTLNIHTKTTPRNQNNK